MTTKIFTVTVDVPDYYGIKVGSADMQTVISDGLPSFSPIRLVSVSTYHPENEVRMSKIPAIKRIRTALNCKLLDAKFLVDTAEKLGTARWEIVTVNYDSALGYDGWQVIVND